jgi:hypothetical protein
VSPNPITPFYRPEHRINPALGSLEQFRGEKLEKIKQFFAHPGNVGRKFSSLALHNTFGTTAFRSRVSDINKKVAHADFGFVILNLHFWDDARQCERSFYYSQPETPAERETRIAEDLRGASRKSEATQ